MSKESRAHILLLPYPSQGHINPMFQFSKRLAFHGVKPTVLITNFNSKNIPLHTPSSVGIETVSDGYDHGGFADAESVEEYLKNFEKAGSQSLTELIKKHQSLGYPVSCVVYDAFMPWALDVAKECGVLGAAFFTQCCAVNNIYYHFHDGKLEIPSSDSPDRQNISISIPGLPSLKVSDMPSFIYNLGSYPAYFELVLNQYLNVEKADWIFVNTFQELEPQIVEWMAKLFPMISTIGPTLPSMYLDKRIHDDTDYGINLYKPDSSVCMNWLDGKPIGSVVYVSFGSMAELGPEQMEELGEGIMKSDAYFLWVVRSSEEEKLPSRFKGILEKGLIVKWSPQLDVLAHDAIGCFVTHCGWNSTLEALCFGVPMVGIPQWTDQTTNAKFVQDVWEVGLRVNVGEEGLVSSDEIERCIREVVEGERGVEMKRKGKLWRKLAKEALDVGGSSDKCIAEFVAKLAGK